MTLVARHAARTDIGLHRRTNEDSWLVEPPLYVVCDGMGGAQAGEVASRLAVETFAAARVAGATPRAAAEEANAAVWAHAAADPARSGMGTTLTAFVLEDDTAHFVHIGDSRAYLLRSGELLQLSDDHSLVGELLREGRLTAEEAAVHPHRSILSRALGTEAHAEFDEFAVDLQPGDMLLLCSDGLSGVVPAGAIAGGLGPAEPEAAARELVDAALAAGGPDNITAVVVRFEAAAGEGGAAEAAGAEGDEPVTEEIPAAPPASDAGPHEPPPGTAAGAPRRRRRLGCLTVALGLVAVIAAAAALVLSTVFFVGVDDGRLTVYSGLPVEVGPVHLNAVWRKSTRTYESLSAAERDVVDGRGLHGEDEVLALAQLLGMWP